MIKPGTQNPEQRTANPQPGTSQHLPFSAQRVRALQHLASLLPVAIVALLL
jgi:hypothetical protein